MSAFVAPVGPLPPPRLPVASRLGEFVDAGPESERASVHAALRELRDSVAEIRNLAQMLVFEGFCRLEEMQDPVEDVIAAAEVARRSLVELLG